MRVLATGGAGFIGSHVVDRLVADGHEAAVLDDVSTGFRDNLNERAHFYQVDIRDADGVEAAVREFRPEIVIHHAAQMDVRVSTRMPAVDAGINIVGSLHVIESAVRHGARKIVYASTGGAVYGEPESLPVREDHPVHPLSQYGISKHTVEHYLYLYRHNFGLDYTVLRYPNVFGPRQNPHGEAGVIAIFLNKALAGERPTIFGDGSQERDYVYVDDVVDANILALDRGGGRILNIGSGVGRSVLDIVRAIEQATGRTVDPIFSEPRVGEIGRIALDASLAGSVLGWRVSVPFAEGVRRTYEYLRAGRDGAQ